MIGKLGLVMVIVSDMERSVAFYRDVLGLELKEESPEWSELDAGTIHVGLHHSTGGVASAGEDEGVQIMFYVDDAEQALDRLRSAGAAVLTEPTKEEWGGTVSVVGDPDGHPIQLLQYA